MATFFSAMTATILQYSIPFGGDGGWGEIANTCLFGSLVLSVASALNAFSAYTLTGHMFNGSRYDATMWRWIRLSPSIFFLSSVWSFLIGLFSFAIATQPPGTAFVVVFCAPTIAILALSEFAKAYFVPREQSTAIFQGDLGPHMEYQQATQASPPSKDIPPIDVNSDHLTIPRGSLEEPAREGSPGSVSSIDLRTRQRPLRRLVGKMMGVNRVLLASNNAQMAVRLTSRLKLVAPTGVLIRLEKEPLVGYPAFSPHGETLAVSGSTHTLRCNLTVPESKELVLRQSYMGSGQRQVAWSYSGSHLLTWTDQNPFIDVWTESTASSSIIKRPRGVGLLIGIQPPIDSNETETAHIVSKFVVVEGRSMNKLTLIDVQGNEDVSCRLTFRNIRIEHVDVSCWLPDIRGWFIAMASTVICSPNGLPSANATPMRQLTGSLADSISLSDLILPHLVFNPSRPDVKFEIPIRHEVQDVKFSPNGRTVAVNYKDNPPQIWSIKRDDSEMISLTLLRQLLAQSPLTMFRGRLSWLGSGRFLLAVTITGELYFWRRDRDVPVHIIRAADNEEDRTAEVSCKMVGNDFTFAVRSREGVVRIWKPYETQHTQSDTL
ncbi:hypothetical protein BU17DRAFT_93914 [Hysterangium stoloniferum]|nr:hypothetical protein BU17DRAFT_93914 [Hysterangium stoloniferum]